MASRKGKPRAKRTSNRDVQAAARESAPDVEAPISQATPSGAMTVEVHALSYAHVAAPPAPPTTVRALDDLAATVEMPALGSLGPRVLVMDAAEAVIAEGGFSPSVVKKTAEWAGVSVDVFHAHFNDERALLAALADRFHAQATTTVDDAVSTATPVEAAIKGVVDLLLGRAALVRAIVADGALVDEFRAVGRHLADGLAGALDGKVDAADVRFAALEAVALAHYAIVLGTDDDREQLSGRAAAAAIAYLSSRSR